jgi:hypothetical protein
MSNVNVDWRQAAQITVERRGHRILRIGLAQIGGDEPGGLGLKYGSASARVSKLSLVSARSVIGENTTAPAGATPLLEACAVAIASHC